MVILTKETLEKGKSKRGGWSNEQINLFGVTMKGRWKKKIVGQIFPKETIDKFLSLKDKHLNHNPNQSELWTLTNL